MKRHEALEHSEYYQVVPVLLESFLDVSTLLEEEAKQGQKEIVLIDLPGKMDDDGLIPVLKAADLILTPFAYDEFSIGATVIFAMVAKEINKTAPICFIPNRIRPNVKYETKAEVELTLAKFGIITPPIAERIDFQRINTYTFPVSLCPVVLPILDGLYNQFLLE